ncbi:MAG: alanine--tRNA ligase [Acidobacteria bacterium]|nr:alanine--tRNA ligase [Acidobacteriota bacterium]
MTSGEIRHGFLAFFEERGHRVVASSPLVPADDPTLLFTNAGMNQFKDLFLGRTTRDYKRAASSQKCMRVSGKHNDLENVGPSLRHHTFFEMLGNFSFGDYFKADAIPFAWKLLTEAWELPAERLYATVFKGEDGVPRDDEAYAIWRRLVPAERIVELGAAENFWAMGDTGPCGRCSEVHYHRGDHLPCGAPRCLGIDCDCDRYVEIWNNVFMEFERIDDGSLTPLPAPSIDTGMGLERIVAVLQDTLSNYDTDLFTPLLAAIGKRTGSEYGPLAGRPSNDGSDVSLRVIADHLRAMTFLIADGVVPSNEWRGYVLRKIMRRAMRHGKKLGMTEPFLHELTGVVIGDMEAAYPELRANRDVVVSTVRREEEQFDRVLRDGLPRLEAALAEAEGGSGLVSGDTAFQLYDTYGVPLDFIEDLAASRKLRVDRHRFEEAMEAQRARARAGSGGTFAAKTRDATFGARAGSPTLTVRVEVIPADSLFVGYDTTTAEGRINRLFRPADSGKRLEPVDALEAGESGYAALDRTPFYLEAGGQVSDTGRLVSGSGAAVVEDMLRPAPDWPRMHAVALREGVLHVGDEVTAEVDAGRRDDIRRNHTATHLLHAALRAVVGKHVRQAGSLVAPDRLRFDVTHHEPVTDEQLAEIERLVSSHVFGNQTVATEERSTEEAIAAGAMALFGEKYGERVRVVTVPGFSVELCGGTHCRATGDIGPFVITHEGGVAAGVRRIEAVTGASAVQLLQARGAALSGLLHQLGTTREQAVASVRRLQADAKRLARDLERLKVKAAMGGAAESAADDTVDIAGTRLITREVSALEPQALRTLADSLRDRLGSGIVVLASRNEGKAALVVSVTRDLVDRVQAGQLVKTLAPIIGGRGGGRPDFAQAGGRQPDKIEQLFAECRSLVTRLLAGSLAGTG